MCTSLGRSVLAVMMRELQGYKQSMKMFIQLEFFYENIDVYF